MFCSPVLGDVHDVLVAHAQLPVHVDPRLVREAHPGDEARLVPPHQVRVFVAVQPDAVTQAMREVAVVGSEAAVFEDLPRCRVHRLALDAGLHRPERRVLGLAHEVPDPALPVGGRGAEDGRP